jgi:hypothetical protein
MPMFDWTLNRKTHLTIFALTLSTACVHAASPPAAAPVEVQNVASPAAAEPAEEME